MTWIFVGAAGAAAALWWLTYLEVRYRLMAEQYELHEVLIAELYQDEVDDVLANAKLSFSFGTPPFVDLVR